MSTTIIRGQFTPRRSLLEELLAKVSAYDPKADVALIKAAYALAMQAHGYQRRDNGDLYITHPVAVAYILADYKLDIASIVTGLITT